MYETLVDYNERNDVPLSNEKIQQAICKVIAEEEADASNINADARNITLDAHNITADTFCQTPVKPNTQ